MRAAFVCIVLAQPILFCSGCQCFRASNLYYNMIDDVSDTQLYADRFYRPTWDLTRIGKPDWCRSRFNRWWSKCSSDCRPEYYNYAEARTEYSRPQQDISDESVDDLVPLPEPATFVPPDPYPNGIDSTPVAEDGPELAPAASAPVD